jgi:TRAP-type C4-dicarboxylate transport system substrate-binding protein
MNLKSAALCAALIAAVPAASHSEPLQIKFGTTGPAFGPLHDEAYSAWSKDVTEASQGTLEVKVYPAQQLGTMINIYDRMLNGVAEVAYMVLGPIATQFPKSTVVMLPFGASNPMEAAQALWRLYERGLIADEYAKCHPVAMAAFTNVSIHARKPFSTLDDIKGWKIGSQSRVTGEVAEKLGGTAVSLPVAESYQALSRGTIDAFATGWPAITPFKMAEVTIAHSDLPLSSEMAFNAMNKDVYGKLPAAAKAAVDKYSGMAFSERMARAIDKMAQGGRRDALARQGAVIVAVSPAEEERWKQRVAPIAEEWAKNTPNGAAVLAGFREEIAKVRAAAKK